MILAIDVDYKNSGATIAGVMFSGWSDEQPTSTFISKLGSIESYVPGQFYKRELPCILHLIEEHKLGPDFIVVDGFVYLDGVSKAGLGLYLYEALAGRIPIIGVAKNAFKDIPPEYEVYRGLSKKPLYVTTVGIDSVAAKELIVSMHGKNRLPTLLKQVDSLCRQN